MERRAKIMATLGPASRDEAVLRELVRAGVDLFRLNLSHGTQEQHRETLPRGRRGGPLGGGGGWASKGECPSPWLLALWGPATGSARSRTSPARSSPIR